MNLKERGITIGDLIIILIIILTTLIIAKPFKKETKTTYIYSNSEQPYFHKIKLLKLIWTIDQKKINLFFYRINYDDFK